MHYVVQIVAGSRMYGTATPDSDTDIRFVWKESLADLAGLKQPDQAINRISREGDDEQGWCLRLFMNLALKGSPNILELLWAPQECVRVWTPDWEALIAHRKACLSTHLRAPYLGFATSELRRFERSIQDEHIYDAKAGMHCLRLLWGGRQLIETGTLSPRLEGAMANTARNIRNRSIPAPILVRAIQQEMSELDASVRESVLPAEPDYATWDALCRKLYLAGWPEVDPR